MNTSDYNFIAEAYKRSKQLPFRLYVESYSLHQMMGDITGFNILDLACGEGFYTRKLKEAGANRVLGVDLSAKMIELAEAHERTHLIGCQYLVSDVAKLPYLGIFDKVVAMYLLNYARTKEELVSYCRAAYHQLRSGGFFIGYNDNPFNQVEEYSSYRKYGFTKQAKEDRQEGDPIHYTFYNTDDTVFTFDNYYLRPQTYAEAFTEAGFTRFQWVAPELHPSQLDDPFWGQFMTHPPVIGFLAEKK
ncbi:MAG: class I SAM-dependent methyltransferase [Cyclobacteriaceae bacterium]